MNIEEEISGLKNKIETLELAVVSQRLVLSNAKDDIKVYKRKIKQLEKIKAQAEKVTNN